MACGFLKPVLKWARRGLALPAALSAACSASSELIQPSPEASVARPARSLKAEPSRGRAASWSRRTLVYPVRWGRAEDLAVTLEPILDRIYGPGARIVVQRESNSLLIVFPE